MSKYTGFVAREIQLLRQGLLFSPGYPKKEFRNFLEVSRDDFQVTHGELIEFYEESVEKLHKIIHSHPQLVYSISLAITKSYGTETYIEYVIQLGPYGEYYLTDEIEHLIKNVVTDIPEVG